MARSPPFCIAANGSTGRPPHDVKTLIGPPVTTALGGARFRKEPIFFAMVFCVRYGFPTGTAEDHGTVGVTVDAEMTA